jgi:hypothetical protein
VKKNTILELIFGLLVFYYMKCYSPFSSNQYGEDEYKVIFRNILKKDYVFDDKLNISNECI